MKLNKIFGTNRPLIGMIHLMPLLGFKGYSGIENILNKAFLDLNTLEKGGVDAIIVENNYDFPHKIIVDSETVASMTYLTAKIVQKTKLPIGISVLWNDYRAAMSIAKVCGAKFIRVPVFVDDVKTQYGKIYGSPKEVMDFKKKIKAKNLFIFTDIQVKHSELISEKTLEESAREAVKNGSDGLIITGNWTADLPIIDDVRKVRGVVGGFPILVGSGVDTENVATVLKYADAVIVGTSLKSGKNNKKNVNIRGYSETIDLKKVKSLVKEFKKNI